MSTLLGGIQRSIAVAGSVRSSFIMVSVHLLGELFWRREESCAMELSIVCSVNTCVLSVGCAGGYVRLIFHISV